MSSAVAFLLVALGAALVGSALLWLVQHRPRRSRPTDFQSQLRAIAPRPGPAQQPPGVARVDPAPEVDRRAPEER